ncbi:MAG TPA: WecB/TagA/CpsF family glycosyltransferase [Blastocatellia bacterium]|nr:WecB/TagA/CpsF family glycosyltransferase [Blastocatellia bacterium]
MTAINSNSLSDSPGDRPRVTVAGIAVNNLTEDETIAAIQELISQGKPHYMAVVNAAKVVAARRDPRLAAVLKSASIVTADGMSVVWASRLLGTPLAARVTGIDTMERLATLADERGLSVYFLGAADEPVRKTVDYFVRAAPGLSVVGFRNGYFDYSESAAVAQQIKESRADILFVGMGSPRQEIWIAENLAETGVRFALGVGGSFDHFSGLSRRAPLWMQHAGLEWVYRLASEPRRLWRRYLIGNTLFIHLVLKQLLSRDSGAP